jgi:two-component system sensor histidine kinase YesM
MKDPLSLWFIVKNYKFQSVFIKNFFIILALILLPVIGLSAGIYNLYNKTVTEEISSAHLNALSRIRDMVDMMIREVDDFSIRIASDDMMKELLGNEFNELSDFDMNVSFDKMYKKLNTMNTIRNIVNSIYVYSENNRYILSSNIGRWPEDEFPDQGWLDAYRDKNNDWIIARQAKVRPMDPEERQQITFNRRAPLFLNQKLGSVLINIDTARLLNLISHVENNYIDDIYIIDANGIILGNNRFELINRHVSEMMPYPEVMAKESNEPVFIYKDGTKQTISHVSSAYNGWKFISIVPLKLYEDKAKYIRNYLILSSLFSILAATILSLVVSWRMFMPIKQIMSVVSRPGEWLEASDRSKPGLNEIKYITSTILTSYGEKQGLEHELRHRLALLDQAYTIALQSQINPHFLYNTLETINWQALRLSGGENPVSEMIASLSQLLRFSLEGDDNLVSIKAEIEHCQHYIDIQQIRYPRKFEVEWRIDEKIKICKIPKITLQPIIENAIYHGIKPKSGIGKIMVTGTLEKEMVTFRIADNGAGIPGEKVEQINAEMANKSWITGSHIGIRNVNQRIKLTFGEHCGLRLASKPGEGTEVTVVFSAVTV